MYLLRRVRYYTETRLILLGAEVVPALGAEFSPDPGVLVDQFSRPESVNGGGLIRNLLVGVQHSLLP